MRSCLRPAICVAALLSMSTSWATVAWDESSDGDLSNDPLAPTPLTFVAGPNIITGNMGGQDDPRDFLTFSIASGQALDGLTLLTYEGDDIVGFHAINAGPTSFIPGGDTADEFLGGNHLYLWDAGSDVLPQLAQFPLAGSGFEIPLGEGTYSYVVQQTGAADTRYSLEFSVVPVPAAAWLFASALGLLGWIRRSSR